MMVSPQQCRSYPPPTVPASRHKPPKRIILSLSPASDELDPDLPPQLAEPDNLGPRALSPINAEPPPLPTESDIQSDPVTPTSDEIISLPSTSATEQYVRLRRTWPWVSDPTIESIKNGLFDPDRLPKLQGDDTLRIQTMKELACFLSAWGVYVSIRIAFAPERAPGLVVFTQHIAQLAQANKKKDFPQVAKYVLSYWRLNQNASPEEWMNHKVNGLHLPPPHVHTSLSRSRPPTVDRSSVSPRVATGPDASINLQAQNAPAVRISSLFGLPAYQQSDSGIMTRFMEYYTPVEHQGPPNVDEVAGADVALRYLTSFISSMDYKRIYRTEERGRFFILLSSQNWSSLYTPFLSVVLTKTSERRNLRRVEN
jgi:hypothetical protein